MKETSTFPVSSSSLCRSRTQLPSFISSFTTTGQITKSLPSALLSSTSSRRRLHVANRSSKRRLTMQIPPKPELYDAPYADADIPSPRYKWDQNFPGTMKPGLVDDNYPLSKVLNSDVYENMVYDEFDMDERVADITYPDEDLLEWLDKNGRLIPKDAADDDFDLEGDGQANAISEDELDDYVDDDSKMIAYYSRQSEGATEGAGLDFGGFSESSSDYGAGF